jgi:hypothetical protein
MYAGVLTAILRQTDLEESFRFVQGLYDEVVIPLVRQAPGYRSALTLFDRGLGVATSIVIYETESDAHHLDPSGEQWGRLFAAFGPERLQRLQSILAEPLNRRVHQVTLQDAL